MKDILLKPILFFGPIIICLRISIFTETIPQIETLYFGLLLLMALLSIYNYISSSRKTLGFGMTIFLLVALASVLFNDIPTYFKVNQRFAGFVILSCAISPLFICEKNTKYHLGFLYRLRLLLTLFSIVSLILRLAGFVIDAKNFGICSHVMMMSPVAAFCCILWLNDYLVSDKKKRVLLLPFVLTFVTSLMAASRSAIGALLVAISVLILLRGKGRGKFKYLIYFAFIFSIIIFINPFGVVDPVMDKLGRDNSDASELLSGRDMMWFDRIEDFMDSPIIGVGFCSMKHSSYSAFDSTTGVVEYGSSWFAILSTMGSLGILSFMALLYKCMKTSMKCEENKHFVAMLCFFLIHMTMEGYIIAFGSVLCLLLWFTICLSITSSKLTQYDRELN